MRRGPLTSQMVAVYGVPEARRLMQLLARSAHELNATVGYPFRFTLFLSFSHSLHLISVRPVINLASQRLQGARAWNHASKAAPILEASPPRDAAALVESHGLLPRLWHPAPGGGGASMHGGGRE